MVFQFVVMQQRLALASQPPTLSLLCNLKSPGSNVKCSIALLPPCDPIHSYTQRFSRILPSASKDLQHSLVSAQT